MFDLFFKVKINFQLNIFLEPDLFVFVCLVYFINSVAKTREKRRESPEGGNDEA